MRWRFISRWRPAPTPSRRTPSRRQREHYLYLERPGARSAATCTEKALATDPDNPAIADRAVLRPGRERGTPRGADASRAYRGGPSADHRRLEPSHHRPQSRLRRCADRTLDGPASGPQPEKMPSGACVHCRKARRATWRCAPTTPARCARAAGRAPPNWNCAASFPPIPTAAVLWASAPAHCWRCATTAMPRPRWPWRRTQPRKMAG